MAIGIRFLGAAEGVTGSRHLLEVDGRRILVDCGLFQGRRSWARERNARFPIDPSSVDAVVLTHGHVDHSGALPLLARDGFRGRITATPATIDLAKILLRDSGRIQESDARHLNKRAKRDARDEGRRLKDLDLVEPLYTEFDAEQVDPLFRPLAYHQERAILQGIRLTFTDQGHILGSAAALLEIDRPDGGVFRIVFSGDRGRRLMPILRDPEPYPDCDVVLTESTYGDRDHEPITDMQARLERVVKETMARGGRLLIPAFSVGRTQNILYHLTELQHEGRLPKIPVFVDSPLSTKASRIYVDHPECWDAEARRLMKEGAQPLDFPGLHYIESVEESKGLNEREGFCVVISASGMCESGRILHHLLRTADRPQDTVLIVGWMAENTLGRRLVEERNELKILGRTVPRLCRIERMNGLSAHADRGGLVRSLSHLKGKTRTVFLVHGERAQSEPLRELLRAEGHDDVRIAELDTSVELAP
ncbi:MAG: MBL fold metallo-hydrolase [Planctomycetota bacterium]